MSVCPRCIAVFSWFSEEHLVKLVENDVHITLMELCSKYPSDSSLMPTATELLAFMNQEGISQAQALLHEDIFL